MPRYRPIRILPISNRSEVTAAPTQTSRQAILALGIRVQRVGGKDQVLKLLVQKDHLQIKIEVSPVLRGSVRPVSMQAVSPEVERQLGYVEVQVLHSHDIYAGKICAALDRQHPRDLFDVKTLLETDGINNDLLEVFIIYLISSDRPISELLSPRFMPLAVTFESQFRGMTLQEVSLQELEETRQSLVQLVNTMLTPTQRKFLVGFKQGEPDWSLLLSVKGVQNLPGVQWKLLNIRRMTPAKRKEALRKLKIVLFE